MVELSLIAECQMFELLVATNPVRPSSVGSGLGALLLHAALVSGVVMARAAQPERPPRQRAEPILVIPPTPSTPAPLPDAPPRPTAPSAPAPRLDLDPPTIPPVSIPPIDRAAAPLDPERIRGLTESSSALPGPATAVFLSSPGGLVRAQETDEPLTATFLPSPVYPRALEEAGVGGRVVARFVVDTAGRVEPATITILVTPHPALAASVRETLAVARFRPGRAHGTPVRVLVELPVTFMR